MKLLDQLDVRRRLVAAFIVAAFLFELAVPAAVQITDQNIDSLLSRHEVVLVNFYADWCRYSQLLAPIYDEAADSVHREFPEAGRVQLAKVDSEAQSAVAARYSVNKYPTLKLFRNGEPMKKEYRGQRSVEAISQYVRDQLKDVLQLAHSDAELDEKLDEKKRSVIGFFTTEHTTAYRTFKDVSAKLRDECQFFVMFGTTYNSSTNNQQNDGEPAEAQLAGKEKKEAVVFRPALVKNNDDIYPHNLDDFERMVDWVHEKCVPFVREITFENAEELTEEGLPFLILFHHPDDKEIVIEYEQQARNQLLPMKDHPFGGVTVLYGDGLKFAHPLSHLGASTNDLPIIAIDSFKHMYKFPYDVRTYLSSPDMLKQFVLDLHSGKLHREFHYGADPTQPPPPPPQKKQEKPADDDTPHLPRADQTGPAETPPRQEQPTDPPESMFAKLKPSDKRYSLKDEL